ncbi:DUF5689 domain-containing protein [Pseudobacter ginsenosidimutans]|uniref:DUF5689 domain-containing protein n=1 Tax=Pseudobacter ginsenosidimutans TaxID=661488 RepID=A0A4Q7N4L7_9BACT|nr:DUF5689 domain-containing protein [Pseudobacter ginsenosidimutans]RZS75948.1 hypothetical protein EV199_1824 [Pseudobacter ginsenosidimutans]
MKCFLYIFSIAISITIIGSCNKETYENYPGGVPFEIVSVLDIRPIYKGKDVALTKETVYGATKIAVVVISEHETGNLPEGLLIVQDSRRLATLRGISIELGAAAEKYHPGDSLVIDINSGMLTRKNGILTITGLTESHIHPAGKGVVDINAVTVAQLQANPNNYESSLCIVNKSSFNPAPLPGEVISGSKKINDGFGDLDLYTDPAVDYANNTPFSLAAYVGIPFMTSEDKVTLRTRNGDDIVNMGSSVQDLLISGFQSDPKGGDGGQEYVQMLATKDIDFAATPYCIVFCVNSGGASSATLLDAGWATGGQRTIKYDINTGSVQKGQFFYFGFQGKKINGSAGTYAFPASTNWYQKTYLTSGNNAVTGSTLPNLGDGGLVHTSEFGTSGPFPNNGNSCGLAIFKGTTITETSVPEDVLFIATGGSAAIFDPAKDPILGYRICNNDWYSMYSVSIDPNTYKPVIVPYLHYRSAGNTNNMPYPINEKYPVAPTDAGLYNMMGGVYNITLGRWTTARKQVVVELVQTAATIDTLEKHISVTKLVE